MEPGFNCSELCDGSSGFSSREQQQRVLQELCAVAVVCTEVGNALGHGVCSAGMDLGGGMERGSQMPSSLSPTRVQHAVSSWDVLQDKPCLGDTQQLARR